MERVRALPCRKDQSAQYELSSPSSANAGCVLNLHPLHGGTFHGNVPGVRHRAVRSMTGVTQEGQTLQGWKVPPGSEPNSNTEECDMSFDKTKFTANPQLDSEGFFVDGGCLGCDGSEPCPRSGMCPRYNSPLRFYDKNTITLHPGEVIVLSNPPGWREPGMQPITWAEDIHEELFRQ